MTKLGHPNPPEVGILTGKAANPLASVTGGTVSADEMLHIQAVFDIRNSVLLLSLLGMKEDGPAGAAVSVKAGGDIYSARFCRVSRSAASPSMWRIMPRCSIW